MCTCSKCLLCINDNLHWDCFKLRIGCSDLFFHILADDGTAVVNDNRVETSFLPFLIPVLILSLSSFERNFYVWNWQVLHGLSECFFIEKVFLAVANESVRFVCEGIKSNFSCKSCNNVSYILRIRFCRKLYLYIFHLGVKFLLQNYKK